MQRSTQEGSKITLYFSDVNINFYEFWKFIRIYGVFKRVNEFEKDKPANGPILAHRPRPHGLVAHWLQQAKGQAIWALGPACSRTRTKPARPGHATARAWAVTSCVAPAATRSPMAGQPVTCWGTGGWSTREARSSRQARRGNDGSPGKRNINGGGFHLVATALRQISVRGGH
jgi:hypothetical protein